MLGPTICRCGAQHSAASQIPCASLVTSILVCRIWGFFKFRTFHDRLWQKNVDQLNTPGRLCQQLAPALTSSPHPATIFAHLCVTLQHVALSPLQSASSHYCQSLFNSTNKALRPTRLTPPTGLPSHPGPTSKVACCVVTVAVAVV